MNLPVMRETGEDSIGSFGIDNSLHLTALAGSLMKALNPLRRNTAAIKWTFNASRNCEGHGLFQFPSGRPISTGPGRVQLTKLLLVLLACLRLLRLPATDLPTPKTLRRFALLIRKYLQRKTEDLHRIARLTRLPLARFVAVWKMTVCYIC